MDSRYPIPVLSIKYCLLFWLFTYLYPGTDSCFHASILYYICLSESNNLMSLYIYFVVITAIASLRHLRFMCIWIALRGAVEALAILGGMPKPLMRSGYTTLWKKESEEGSDPCHIHCISKTSNWGYIYMTLSPLAWFYNHLVEHCRHQKNGMSEWRKDGMTGMVKMTKARNDGNGM